MTSPSPASDSNVELRFVHSHDANYSRETVHPDWKVDVQEEGKRGTIRPVDEVTEHGGYVLIGRTVTVPQDVADARVTMAYGMSFVENAARSVSGHLGLAIMTEDAWKRLAADPKAAGTLNFYRNKDWIYHVKLNGYNSSAEDPSLS